jgi:hypothetical protein
MTAVPSFRHSWFGDSLQHRLMPRQAKADTSRRCAKNAPLSTAGEAEGVRIFDRRLLIRIDNASDGKTGRYDFVVNLA